MLLKLLCVTLLLAIAAEASPNVRHRWQLNAMKLESEVTRGRGRIVGGRDTDIEEVPHQVVLHYRRSFTCGASIINPNTVLSAAHCTHGRDANDFQILVGQTNRTQGTLMETERLIEHEMYDDWTLEYDLVVLKMGEGNHILEDGITVRRVALPTPGHFLPDGFGLTVSGFGTMEWQTNRFPDILQSADVPAWSNERCQQIYVDEDILEQHVCAGIVGRDACQGDSGGPLTENFGTPQAMIVGVVSWGYFCAREYPSVYARVSYFLGWILQHTG